jgi:hypothetical protein
MEFDFAANFARGIKKQSRCFEKHARREHWKTVTATA